MVADETQLLRPSLLAIAAMVPFEPFRAMLPVKKRRSGALTQFWCSFRSDCSDEARFEQIEFCAPIHLALHKFQFGDLSLGLSIGPDGGDRGSNSGLFFRDAVGEGGYETGARSFDPGVEFGFGLRANHCVECGYRLARFDE
jgi:hypothetical protein